MDLSMFSKAIAGGVVGLVVAEAARYGFQPDPATVTFVGVVVTAVVGYAVGHLALFFAPANKVALEVTPVAGSQLVDETPGEPPVEPPVV